MRHLPAQHAALAVAARFALAGDDEHEGAAVAVGTLQEAEEDPMRAGLGHAVQVKAGVNLLLATREL